MIPDFVRPEYIVVTLVMFALVLAVYIAQAIFLNKFHYNYTVTVFIKNEVC